MEDDQKTSQYHTTLRECVFALYRKIQLEREYEANSDTTNTITPQLWNEFEDITSPSLTSRPRVLRPHLLNLFQFISERSCHGGVISSIDQPTPTNLRAL